MGNSRSSKSSTSSRNNNNMTTTTATTTSATTPTTPTYIRRAYHAGSWYSDDPAGLERTLNKYMDDASNDLQLVSSTTKNDNGNNNNNDNGQGQGGQSGQGQGRLRAIICPHAGYRYSGPTAAYSYYSLQEELLLTASQSQKESSSDSYSSSSSSNKASKIRHIVVFHPSHHYYLNGCAVSNASTIETPIGNLQVSNDLREEILALNNNDINNDINSDINNDNDKDNAQQQQLKFTTMTQSVDEAEHSGEMQYPFLALVLKNTYGRCLDDDNSMNVSVLPIMCGNIDVQQEVGYGRLLSPIINRPDVFCIVSTDFCHYGRRFQYLPTPSTLPLLPLSSSSSSTTTTTTTTTTMELYQYITQLDHEGMRLIELQKPGGFADYLKRTKNTICGRHAVQTWLNGVVNGARNESSSNDGSGGSGGGGGGGNPTLQVKFIKYAQSSQLVRSGVNDSSVSYASATARLVLNE